MSGLVERVASAIEMVSLKYALRRFEGMADSDPGQGIWEEFARAAIEAMRSQTLVYRDNGHVVHEMRGAPDDIWKALLDAALGEGE